MVDRITPATTPAVIADVLGEFAIDDEWPVRSESFVQWVLEDKFSPGCPPFENVGVQMVDDVMPYEHMKLRLLNASSPGHELSRPARGHTHVHEVMGDPDLSAFVTSYMRNEAAPTRPGAGNRRPRVHRPIERALLQPQAETPWNGRSSMDRRASRSSSCRYCGTGRNRPVDRAHALTGGMVRRVRPGIGADGRRQQRSASLTGRKLIATTPAPS